MTKEIQNKLCRLLIERGHEAVCVIENADPYIDEKLPAKTINALIVSIESALKIAANKPEPSIDLSQERIDYYENKIEILQRIINQKPEPSIQEDRKEEVIHEILIVTGAFYAKERIGKIIYEFLKQLNK